MAAPWRRRAPKTHSLLITLFTSFSGAINREKRSRDFINQGKKCITVAQEKHQLGYGISLIVRFLAKNCQKLSKVAINREKRSRDFINQGKKCITVAQEKRQFGYEIALMVGPNISFFVKN